MLDTQSMEHSASLPPITERSPQELATKVLEMYAGQSPSIVLAGLVEYPDERVRARIKIEAVNDLSEKLLGALTEQEIIVAKQDIVRQASGAGGARRARPLLAPKSKMVAITSRYPSVPAPPPILPAPRRRHLDGR